MIKSNLPAINPEVVSFEDAYILGQDVGSLRSQLEAKTQQLQRERECARAIQHSRLQAIFASPALCLVFEVDEDEAPKAETETSEEDITMRDLLASAFVLDQPDDVQIPEGFTDTLQRSLRTQMHPDQGGDSEKAKDVGEALNDIKFDSDFSVARALLAKPKEDIIDIQALRDERYNLTLALGASVPIFESKEQAEAHAKKEMKGTEWRVRTFAAVKTLELITGGSEVWYSFLEGIARQNNPYIIGMVNRLIPEMYSLVERFEKGDAISIKELDTEAVDAVFQRIWSTIGDKDDSAVPYCPPYQNWLDILLPAMRLLDPGRKSGENYTRFEPPIRRVRQPVSYRPPNSFQDRYSTQEEHYSNRETYKNRNQNYYNSY